VIVRIYKHCYDVFAVWQSGARQWKDNEFALSRRLGNETIRVNSNASVDIHIHLARARRHRDNLRWLQRRPLA
jgi:hypothetical protein